MDKRSMATRACLFFILLTHVFAAWFHGAELVWEVTVVAILVSFAALCMLVAVNNVPSQLRAITWPLLIFAIWLSYLLFTTLPVPIRVVEWLNPTSITWHLKALGGRADAPLSIAPHTTLLEVFEFFTLLLLFTVTALCLTRTTRAITLTYWLIIIGVSIALYGLLNHLTDGRYELVEAIPPWDAEWSKTIRGTFSYKNQNAVYVAMLIPLIVGLIQDQFSRRKKEFTRKSFWHGATLMLLSRVGTLSLCALLMVFVLSRSDSRGGIVALLAAALIIYLKQYFKNRDNKRTRRSKRAFWLISAVLAIVFINSTSFERFQRYGVQDNGRGALHQVAKRVFFDFPVVGSGAGTYPLIQHNYKPVELGNTAMSKRAHSDYLELLATQGIVGCLLLMVAFALLLKPVFTGRAKRHPKLLLGCQCSLLVLILHSTFDFNYATFYLPALFFAIVAIAYALIAPQSKVPSHD